MFHNPSRGCATVVSWDIGDDDKIRKGGKYPPKPNLFFIFFCSGFGHALAQSTVLQESFPLFYLPDAESGNATNPRNMNYVSIFER
jgi:hypothetical protein